LFDIHETLAETEFVSFTNTDGNITLQGKGVQTRGGKTVIQENPRYIEQLDHKTLG